MSPPQHDGIGFLDLPLEVRTVIYQELLSSSVRRNGADAFCPSNLGTPPPSDHRAPYRPRLAILSTSRQIHAESAAALYGSKFGFYGFTPLLRFLEVVGGANVELVSRVEVLEPYPLFRARRVERCLALLSGLRSLEIYSQVPKIDRPHQLPLLHFYSTLRLAIQSHPLLGRVVSRYLDGYKTPYPAIHVRLVSEDTVVGEEETVINVDALIAKLRREVDFAKTVAGSRWLVKRSVNVDVYY